MYNVIIIMHSRGQTQYYNTHGYYKLCVFCNINVRVHSITILQELKIFMVHS